MVLLLRLFFLLRPHLYPRLALCTQQKQSKKQKGDETESREAGLWWQGAKELEERFAALDMTLVCNRKGATIFPAAQQGVQTLSQRYERVVHLIKWGISNAAPPSKRNFSLQHLAQILTGSGASHHLPHLCCWTWSSHPWFVPALQSSQRRICWTYARPNRKRRVSTHPVGLKSSPLHCFR